MTRRQRRTFSTEFKKQLVLLYKNNKPRKEIIKEYDLNPSRFDRWVRQYDNSGSFKEEDNRTDEETELIELRKKIEKLEMENDILKQAALIMGRKRSEEHTSELQSRGHLVCRLLLEKKNKLVTIQNN